MKIITNNQPRDIIYSHELTPKEATWFDYLNWDAIEAGSESAEFVRYKGEIYHLQDTERSTIDGWDSMLTDTFFSGILIKWCNDFEQVIIGRFYG
jgi:hypothetical protein